MHQSTQEAATASSPYLESPLKALVSLTPFSTSLVYVTEVQTDACRATMAEKGHYHRREVP